jgi:hypothetical protein
MCGAKILALKCGRSKDMEPSYTSQFKQFDQNKNYSINIIIDRLNVSSSEALERCIKKNIKLGTF